MTQTSTSCPFERNRELQAEHLDQGTFLIPQTGRHVIIVDDKGKSRAGFISAVISHGYGDAECDISYFTNDDAQPMRIARGCKFSTNGSSWTWCYDVRPTQRVSKISFLDEVHYGDKTIAKDADGIYDEASEKVTIAAQFVTRDDGKANIEDLVMDVEKLMQHAHGNCCHWSERKERRRLREEGPMEMLSDLFERFLNIDPSRTRPVKQRRSEQQAQDANRSNMERVNLQSGGNQASEQAAREGRAQTAGAGAKA